METRIRQVKMQPRSPKREKIPAPGSQISVAA
jgi:hypothetical protein